MDELKQQLGSCHDVLEKNGITRRKGNYSCPFHEDKTPSFSVSDNGERFKCFSCDRTGDCINLQAEFDGITNKEEIKKLASVVPTPLKESEEIKYIKSRGIDYKVIEKIVDVRNNTVFLNIRDGDCKIVGKQSRSCVGKKFELQKGGKTGIFFENESVGGADLFIVEGMFDFLTIRQSTEHVMGYVSATAYRTDVKKIISQYRNIYWLGDQDESGKILREKFMEICPDLSIYELPKMKEKIDVNDLFRGIDKNSIVQNIKDICILTQEGKITTVKDHLKNITKQFEDSKGVPFTWGTRERDLKLGILNRGQYNVLAGETGAGKTEFSFFLARENARRDHKILYISLEMNTEALLSRYVRKKSGITREERLDGNVPKFKIEKAEEILKGIPDNIEFWGSSAVSVNEIKAKLDEKKYDMIFIDNFGFIEEDSGTDDKFQEISRSIVNLKKQNNCCIIALHHFRKDQGRKGIRSIQDFRGSAKIGDDVDLGIHYCRAKDPETDKDKCACMVRILKDRDEGEIAEFEMFFKHGTFIDSYEN